MRAFLGVFLSALILLVSCSAGGNHAYEGEELAGFFNPIRNEDMLGDPWAVYHDGYYYLTFSTGEGVSICKSKTLSGMLSAPIKQVWSRLPDNLTEIWAPELHFVDGHLYCFFSADRDFDNRQHRMYVIKSKTDDPLGEWESVKKLDLPDDQWAIDGTFFKNDDGKMYFIWSGWKDEAEGASKFIQYLYICELSSPDTVKPGTKRVIISTPEKPWEGEGLRQNEGPVILRSPNGRIFCVYSCSFSGLNEYKLGMLELKGDPMLPESWVKFDEPVFQKNVAAMVYGPGHCSFVPSPDGSETWIVYHAAKWSGAGWDRSARIQKIAFDSDGTPQLGTPLSTAVLYDLPSGEKAERRLYEAEKAAALPAVEMSDASNGKVIKLSSALPRADFKIAVTQGGSYACYIRYVSYLRRSYDIDVSVNGGEPAALSFKGGGGSYSVVCTILNLVKGENTITFSKDFEPGVEIFIDCIALEHK